MIISCPNCGARYRLAATALAQPTRMRCAACEHRWVADAQDAVETPAPIVPEPAAPEATEIEAPEPAFESAEEPSEGGGSGVMRTVVAVVIGGALAIAAGALWVARIDPAELPLVGDRIGALAPRPSPLEIVFKAHTTELPSGDRLLEITGHIKNTGIAPVTLPDLAARLATSAGTVRRWRIAAPVSRLAPGASTNFGSTATGFPTDATIVAIRPAG